MSLLDAAKNNPPNGNDGCGVVADEMSWEIEYNVDPTFFPKRGRVAHPGSKL